MSKDKVREKPLDDLLSMRGKPFSNWKEERKYLREKWGMQGRQIYNKKENEDPEQSKAQKKQELDT